jgi:RND family efflux transporter MFP subunit
MRLDPTDFSLASNSTRAAAEAAHAQMVKTAADEERSRKLATAGWSSAQAYDQTKAAADAAAAQLAAAEAQAKQTANQLTYAELTADADGVVMDVPAEPGQVVAAGQPVIKLARDGAREAEIFLPEGSQRWADSQAEAILYVDRDRVFPARLRELSAIADPATRTFRARYVLGGAGEGASLGSTVTVELALDLRSRDATHDVPLGAIFDFGDGTSVWKLDPARNIVTAEPVTVVRLREERAEVVSGLAEGDQIVALGAHLLKDGQRVRVATTRLVGTR